VRHFLLEDSLENSVLNICTLKSVIHHFFFSMRGQIIVAIYDPLLNLAEERWLSR